MKTSDVMVRASWPGPLCVRDDRGVHWWVQARDGIICDRCADFLPWSECRDYQRWCFYIIGLISEPVARLN